MIRSFLILTLTLVLVTAVAPAFAGQVKVTLRETCEVNSAEPIKVRDIASIQPLGKTADKLGDVVVGMGPLPGANRTIEAGYVIPFTNTNPATGSFTAGSEIIDRTQEGGAQFGAVILVPGDLTGDLYPDCVIAAPSASSGATAGAGTLTLFRSAGNGTFVTPAATDVYGPGSPTTDGAAGASLAAADLDDDLIPDLVVGAPGPLDSLSLLPGQVEILHAQ